MWPVRAAEDFVAYGTSHQAALLVLLAGAAALVVLGRRHAPEDQQRPDHRHVAPERAHPAGGPGWRDDPVGKSLAMAILVFTVPLQLLYFTPGYWSLERTLPLQLCDLAWMAAAYALWTHRWWAVALTYYWGLTLTTQAVLTPDLAAPFPDPVFFLFWGMHLLIVWAAVYLAWGLRLAPDWRGYRAALVVTGTWAVFVFCFNLLAGTNYGYLNAKPASASVLDLLGEWPWYVLAESVIIAVAWALMTLPGAAARGRHRTGQQQADRQRT